MEWKTFAGAVGSELSALILLRATADGIDVQSRDALANYFRSHLERGISSLQNIRSIAEMVDLSKS
jgi:DNA sulfur modification protein DndE